MFYFFIINYENSTKLFITVERESAMKNKKFVSVVTMALTATMGIGCLTGCEVGNRIASTGENEVDKGYGDESDNTVASDNSDETDKITIVWYPNESAEDYNAAREAYGKLIEQATGKKVDQKMTTDYTIAIEAIANGTAQIAYMGAEGYVQAKNKSDAVTPLFVNSGASGTLDDALYYSFLAVKKDDKEQYTSGEGYSLDHIKGKRMSFVSNSSTSGFKVPTNEIVKYFSKTKDGGKLTVDDLIEGGSDAFFSEVLFGGSHQGSAYNLLSGKADIAAFCNNEMVPYADCTGGTENEMGAVYTIRENASAPFDTLEGSEFVVIQSTPVLNGPFAYNADTLSAEDVTAIQTLFTSQEVADNEMIFVPEGSEQAGLFEKDGKKCFLLVDDAWYDPIRTME